MSAGRMDSCGEPFLTKDESAYEYTAHVRAWETFSNLINRYGVKLREGDRHVTFRSERRIDMKGMKEKRLLWSYTIAKIVVERELLEKG
jgi:hypothetical protein